MSSASLTTSLYATEFADESSYSFGEEGVKTFTPK
jgi:hypothetical protein